MAAELPPPPPAVAAPRPGQLTLPWRMATVVMWLLVFVAFTGVWKASTELGLSTWWLGPFGDPRPAFVLIVPFYLPGAMVVAALSDVRWLPWLGAGAGALTALIGVPDLGRVSRLGVIEIAIGLAAIAFAVASAGGLYRRA